MDTLNLSLRQRKLIHMLQNQNNYITGNELAKQLSVSPRTIRSDINIINHALAPHRAKIVSERSKGYFYHAENPEKIQKMNQIETAFFSREDRTHFLAFRLCLSDEPLNLYDLEEETYVSHTTLENDLRHLKGKYCMDSPYMKLHRSGDNIWFHSDEAKIRLLLNHLFWEDWNYNKSENAYYDYQFLDRNIMKYVTDMVPHVLYQYGICMEDPSLVSLNLAITIMYHRVTSGHYLPEDLPISWEDSQSANATNCIFDTLENKWNCIFRPEERNDIYQRILSGRISDAAALSVGTAPDCFDPSILTFANEYLTKITATFGIDFSSNEDFYITLLMFLKHLSMPAAVFHLQGNRCILKKTLLIEYEISYLIEELSLKYLGHYIRQTELLYLAHCIYGALENLQETYPDTKLQTVICSHFNMPATWALKERIMGVFDRYLNLVTLLPVNAKDTFNFSNIDLVISTAQKIITNNPGTETIYFDSILSYQDFPKLSEFIRKKQLERIAFCPNLSVAKLLENAFWHEEISSCDRFDIIELLASDFINNGFTSEAYLEDVLRRESLSTNALNRGILFLHSLVPSQKTALSVAILQAPVVWCSQKIHIVVMAAFQSEHASYVFHLLNLFFDDHLDADRIKTKESFIKYFS